MDDEDLRDLDDEVQELIKAKINELEEADDVELACVGIQATDMFRAGEGEPDDALLIDANRVRVVRAGGCIDEMRGLPLARLGIENADAATARVGGVVQAILAP